MGYPIPPASATAWEKHASKSPQNPGLIFDRFAPDWSENKTLKKAGLEAVSTAAKAVDTRLLAAWNGRWGTAALAACAVPFTLRTDWRLIAGLGRKGPLEAGFTFHRYGFPILPGSSVKGIARVWGLITVATQLGAEGLGEVDKLLSLAAEAEYEQRLNETVPRWTPAALEMARQFRAIFGTTGAAGKAIFFDAIPSQPPKLELDLMNPHFPNYYGDKTGKVPPADWQSPNPVYFLTVAPGVEFRFAVGWRGPLDEAGLPLRDRAREWLTLGLTELGAGAKTSAGYGYFVASEAPLRRAPLQETAAVAAPPGLPATSTSAEWFMATVREYRPDRGWGRLVDADTGAELQFGRQAIEEKGWSPGKGHKVRYIAEEQEGQRVVVRVRRA